MYSKIFASTLAILSVQAIDTPDFDEKMATNFPDYEYEVIEVTTDDGYILPLYHVWSADLQIAEKAPILFGHPGQASGADMLGRNQQSNSKAVQMIEAGHHVYLGNQRGTQYALTTVNGGGAAVDPAAFWDFTFTDMGLDYKAFAQEMSSRHVDQKGHFIGLSTSTLSMFAAISQYEEEIASYLHNVIMLSPCTVIDVEASPMTNGQPLPEDFDAMRTFDYLASLGVYSYGGADWQESKVTICEGTFDLNLCRWARRLRVNRKNALPFKANVHAVQNWQTDSFQEYISDYQFPGNSVAEQFAIDEVTSIGVTLIAGQDDVLCPAATAQDLADSLQPGVLRELVLVEGGHGAPFRNNDAVVMDAIWDAIENCDGC